MKFSLAFLNAAILGFCCSFAQADEKLVANCGTIQLPKIDDSGSVEWISIDGYSVSIFQEPGGEYEALCHSEASGIERDRATLKVMSREMGIELMKAMKMDSPKKIKKIAGCLRYEFSCAQLGESASNLLVLIDKHGKIIDQIIQMDVVVGRCSIAEGV